MKLLEQSGLDGLLEALAERGYRLVGPKVADGAIVYEEIRSTADLPAGWTDEQEAGTYRLARRDDDALFGYAVGPQSWKRLLHPPSVTLFRARRNGEAELELVDDTEPPEPMAFIGVRSCDLHAIAKLDRVFLGGRYVNADYERRRGNVFVVAVNCGVAASTCFCVSMGTGPRAESGYDIAVTEVLEGGRRYLAEAGSEAGADLLAGLPGREATTGDVEAGERVVDRTAASMGRRLDTDGLPELLAASREHPRWDEVAERCLTCGNCTMVCPTCFCTTVEDLTDLHGTEAERRQVWDSCFTLDFTYLHGGGGVRSSPRARYRQWLTHKLGTWHDQFGSSGCVGCGRCIAWCPVGIDITEEAAALREDTS